MNTGKKILIGGTLLAALLTSGRKAKAEDQTLEETVSKGNITINYRAESEREGVDYFTSWAMFDQNLEVLQYSPNVLELTSGEMTQVEDIIKDIKNIDSYQSFVENAEDFSEEQKLVLLGAIGGLLGKFTYISSNEEVASQDVFFDKLQDSLISGNQNDLGMCGHIHSHVEQLANDLGIRAAAVSGIGGGGTGHVYTLLNTNDGNAIVDYSSIVTTNTENIEKTLEAYQKWRGTTAFKHVFWEDTKFKYRLITREGRHFLDFLDYDESSMPLRNALISNVNDLESAVAVNQGNYLNSFESGYSGFFVKVGNIKGNSFSPMNSMELLQTGYNGKFSVLNGIDIGGSASFVYGRLRQDKEMDNDEILGIMYDLIATKNKGAFDFGLRVAGCYTERLSSTPYNNLFYDFTTGVGVSYKVRTKRSDIIKPYLTLQYSLFPKDIGTQELVPVFNELNVGTLFDIKTPNGTHLSVRPYYTKRMWEEEFGANAGIGNEDFKLKFGAYITESDYGFCPHKNGFSVGLHTNLRNLGVGLDFKREGLDYNGEKENRESLDFKVRIKF